MQEKAQKLIQSAVLGRFLNIVISMHDMKTTYFSLWERLQVAGWGGKLKSGAVSNISLCTKFECSRCIAKHFLQCSLRHTFSGLSLLNITYFLPGSPSFCAIFANLLTVWVSRESEQSFAFREKFCFAFVPRQAHALFLLEAPRWWQRPHFCCVSQGNSVALWILLLLALWYRALSDLSLFSTAAISITGVCWYVLLEGCSANSWGLSTNRHKQRCCV